MSVDAGASTSELPVVKKEKKDKKDKKAKEHGLEEGDKSIIMDVDGEEKQAEEGLLSPIAHPLAQKKLSKKVFKTIKKASKSRGHVKRGVKEVVKALRKGEKGLVILAGDISPVDILSHIPVLCEDTGNPYIFVTSKDALGAASSTKRPTSCVMVVPGGSKKQKEGTAAVKEEYAEEYESVHQEVKDLGEKLIFATA
ncbi:L30e-like protein [Tilletiaria anomala UBC 951]|uniref:H/ACA ribonucleoprotein complex subunit 2 n=1 Tax=Tilletiaria anomala (strain ATCC 24038 / CBS 436.72 / UBC 951) TaxID=1037660 RepID=A0A066WFY2_TILAU|nr:L30e-like protein [Tilletiaria anomala UBC 951]KDN52847.1 L30e-like protein [Tilletiaria anomala UBC 951]